MTKYFVWVQSLLGPKPQIWNGEQVDGNDKAKSFIFKRKLELYEENLGLDMLAKFYRDEAGL